MVFEFRGAFNEALGFGLFSALLLGTSSYLYADDHGDVKASDLEETIVTASYLGSSEVGESGNAQIIRGEDLATSATLGLGDALDDLLGVSVTDFGSAVSRPTIRGLTGDRVAVLSNGVRACLLYTSPSPRDGLLSRMPFSA